MLDITKLKDNDRIKFSDETFVQITNYEIDISNLKGTVIECEDMIAIKLDKHFSDLDEWDNQLHFDISKNTMANPYEMQFGTSVDYLKKAKLIKENSNGK